MALLCLWTFSVFLECDYDAPKTMSALFLSTLEAWYRPSWAGQGGDAFIVLIVVRASNLLSGPLPGGQFRAGGGRQDVQFWASCAWAVSVFVAKIILNTRTAPAV